MGKSRTASSLRILQDGNVAKVVGCSGAIRVACPPVRIRQEAQKGSREFPASFNFGYFDIP